MFVPSRTLSAQKEKFLRYTNLLSGSNEGSNVDVFTCLLPWQPLIKHLIIFKKVGSLQSPMPDMLTRMVGFMVQPQGCLAVRDKKQKVKYRCTSTHYHPHLQECGVHAHVHFFLGGGYTARCGCSNNVCCLKGYNMFPVCYKTPGSGSCCDSQLLLQKRITVEDHVRLWRSHCLQSSACGVHSNADVQVLVTGDWPS